MLQFPFFENMCFSLFEHTTLPSFRFLGGYLPNSANIINYFQIVCVCACVCVRVTDPWEKTILTSLFPITGTEGIKG